MKVLKQGEWIMLKGPGKDEKGKFAVMFFFLNWHFEPRKGSSIKCRMQTANF